MITLRDNETVIGGLRWIAGVDAAGRHVWNTHHHEHLLRARQLTGRWIVSRETSDGWIYVANGVTMAGASTAAEDWLTR